MTRQIFAAEINFEDTPLHIRERFNDTEKNIKRLLMAFRDRAREVFILATRHRFTVYIVHGELTPLTDFFHTEHKLKGYVQYYYNSGESVTHLMATASGLLSPVKGEGRVLTELMQGYQWALECSTLGITLDRTLTRTIEIAKAVRTQTGIDKFCASVVETGIELLYDRLEDLHNKKFLIVGTGKMARLALKYLTREGIGEIYLTGHDPIRAQALARKYDVRDFPMDLIREFFLKADVVLGVSHEDLPLNLACTKVSAGGKDDEKTRFVLDLGIPPNFDSRAVDPYAAEFYNLDDLRRLQPSSPLESFGGLEAAWRMVMKASNDLVYLLDLLSQSPVLTAYLSRQFSLKHGAAPKEKPRRGFRQLFQFRKAESVLTTHGETYFNARVHANNHTAENAREIVSAVNSVKKFKFYFLVN